MYGKFNFFINVTYTQTHYKFTCYFVRERKTSSVPLNAASLNFFSVDEQPNTSLSAKPRISFHSPTTFVSNYVLQYEHHQN
jgi:hypothetical protein